MRAEIAETAATEPNKYFAILFVFSPVHGLYSS